MTIKEEWVSYGSNNEFSGFTARLDGVESLPAVIVIQEIWGVDGHIQDVVRRLAGAGYVAFAPDLFALKGIYRDSLTPDRVELAKAFLNTIPSSAWRNPDERDEALILLPLGQRMLVAETLKTLLGGLNPASFYDHLTAAADFLRNTYRYSKGQGVASVGFCMGGALSAVLASLDSELKGAVIFYGNAPTQEQITSIKCSVLGLYGELDTKLVEGLPAFAAAMKQAGKSLDYTVYPQAQHAFFNDTRPSYQNKASRSAYARLLGFLEETLNE
ncbi:MAG: dienelactone hydrolase family protein [Paenibacillaceae bacterium]